MIMGQGKSPLIVNYYENQIRWQILFVNFSTLFSWLSNVIVKQKLQTKSMKWIICFSPVLLKLFFNKIVTYITYIISHISGNTPFASDTKFRTKAIPLLWYPRSSNTEWICNFNTPICIPRLMTTKVYFSSLHSFLP